MTIWLLTCLSFALSVFLFVVISLGFKWKNHSGLWRQTKTGIGNVMSSKRNDRYGHHTLYGSSDVSQKYVMAMFRYFVFQREKIDKTLILQCQ